MKSEKLLPIKVCVKDIYIYLYELLLKLSVIRGWTSLRPVECNQQEKRIQKTSLLLVGLIMIGHTSWSKPVKYMWNVMSVVVLLYYKFTIRTSVIALLLQVQQKIGRLAFTCFRYRVGCRVKGTLSRYFNKLLNKSDERKRRSIDNRLTQTYTLPNRGNPLGMRPRSFSLSFLFPSIHQSQSHPSHIPFPFTSLNHPSTGILFTKRE